MPDDLNPPEADRPERDPRTTSPPPIEENPCSASTEDERPATPSSDQKSSPADPEDSSGRWGLPDVKESLLELDSGDEEQPAGFDWSNSDAVPVASFPPPGPGVIEALCWTVGVVLVHMLAAGFTAAFHMTLQYASNGRTVPNLTEGALNDMFLPIMIGEMAIFVSVAVLSGLLRTGPDSLRKLGLRRMSMHHLLLVVSISIPLSLLCGGLHTWTTQWWDAIAQHLPPMLRFENSNINEMLQPLGKTTPLWLLLLVVAVAPALGEELVFRGVIGRGLVARYGFVGGVTMTSLLFAAVHMHPAHVVSLLPLAVFLHLVYLTTRSFWAPVLLHLGNNGLAAVMLKVSGDLEAATLDNSETLNPLVILAAASFVIPAGIALWRSRIEFRLPNGQRWNPGYLTADSPPGQFGASAEPRPCDSRLIAMAIGGPLLFSALFVASVIAQLVGQA